MMRIRMFFRNEKAMFIEEQNDGMFNLYTISLNKEDGVYEISDYKYSADELTNVVVIPASIPELEITKDFNNAIIGQDDLKSSYDLCKKVYGEHVMNQTFDLEKFISTHKHGRRYDGSCHKRCRARIKKLFDERN